MGLLGPPDVAKLEAEGDVKGLIKALGYRKDSSVGYAAATALARIGADPEPLVAALNDRNGTMRAGVFVALVRIGPPAVLPLAAALRGGNPEVRRSAARLLGQIGGPQAVEPLVAALWDHDYSVRDNATDALSKIGSPVVRAALKDQSEDVRRVAAEAIAYATDHRARVDAMVAAAKTKPSVPVKPKKSCLAHGRQHSFAMGGVVNGYFYRCSRCGALMHVHSGTISEPD